MDSGLNVVATGTCGTCRQAYRDFKCNDCGEIHRDCEPCEAKFYSDNFWCPCCNHERCQCCDEKWVNCKCGDMPAIEPAL